MSWAIWLSLRGHSARWANPARWKTRMANLFPGEVVGFRGPAVLSMPLDKPQASVRRSHRDLGARPSLRVGPDLLGRVIDARGNPLDSRGEYRATRTVPSTVPYLSLEPGFRLASRSPAASAPSTGLWPAVAGSVSDIWRQRGGQDNSGRHEWTRATAADLTVLALVGERGREVGDFLKRWATRAGGGQWSWVSTSDQSPLLRIRRHWPRLPSPSISAPAEKRFYWCLIRSLDLRWRNVNWTGGWRTSDGERLHPIGSCHDGAAH